MTLRPDGACLALGTLVPWFRTSPLSPLLATAAPHKSTLASRRGLRAGVQGGGRGVGLSLVHGAAFACCFAGRP